MMMSLLHQKDTFGAYPVQPIKYSKAVQPELNDDDTSQCIAICSDYIEKHKKLL